MKLPFQFALALALTALMVAPALAQAPPGDGYVLPPAPVQELFDRDKNIATLDRMSPDGDHFLVPLTQELSNLAIMSERTLRLAMLEFTPQSNREWNLSTSGDYGLSIYSLKARRSRRVELPEGVFVSDYVWSPDGGRLAFLAHFREGTQVWTADVATGQAGPLADAWVMATLGGARRFGGGAGSRMVQWTSDGAVLSLLVPSDRGPEPAASPVPPGPIVRRTRDKPTPTSTLPFLLRTLHDEALFKYYTTAQLARLEAGKSPSPIGEPAMYLEFSVSPDGRHILRERLVEPFSSVVGYTSFGRELEVIDAGGRVLSSIRSTPLQEAQRRGGGGGGDDARDVAWRPDGKGLSFLMREPRPRGEAGAEAEAEAAPRKDRIMLLAPPFDMAQARAIVATDHGLSGVSYAPEGRYAFATLAKTGEGPRRQDIVAFDLLVSPPAPRVLAGDIDPEDVVALPGSVMTRATGNGVVSAIVSSDGAAWLEGDGYQPDFRPRPFIDRVVIASGEKRRVFEGAADRFEQPLVPLDDDMSRLVISREGKNVAPDSFLWARDGQAENLTNNRDPYAEITAARREDFEFTRRDGLKIQGRISLPLGYQPGTRVPAIFWTYPREYADAEEYGRAAIRSRNHNAFTPLSFLRWSDIWLTQGYAVVYPDIPILGEDGRYNDHFVSDMTDSLYAAIRKVDELGFVDVDRLGHGGHSYGAFTTANALAHTPFFKAGIAGDGAYNRTLTPMTFQGERRDVWDAPETYLEMSPFFYADQINTPLLMYHGAQDNNSGTFLIQSERMIQALTGLGKTAVLYVYPFESHGPRAKENYLDLWARWLEWFDRHVKGT